MSNDPGVHLIRRSLPPGHTLVQALRERGHWGAVLAEGTPVELIAIGQAPGVRGA